MSIRHLLRFSLLLLAFVGLPAWGDEASVIAPADIEASEPAAAGLRLPDNRLGVAHREEWSINIDNLKLFSQNWAPGDGSARAVLVLIHGTVEHSGLYEPVAQLMAERGYVVQAVDLQGWGRSEGKGARGFIHSYDEYVRDLQDTLRVMRQRYPGRKVYLVGESLGATVALYGHLRGELPADGLIFSGPGYKPGPSFMGMGAPGFVDRMALWAGSIFGSLFPNWPTLPANMGIRLAIGDKAMRQQMLADPYVAHNWLPAAYLTAIEKADAVNRHHLENLHVPLLVLHGSKDRLIPLSSSAELVQRAGSSDKMRKIYEGMPHATLIEGRRLEVANDVLAWLDARS